MLGAMTHPLSDPEVVRSIEAAVSAHAGQSWRLESWTDLGDRSSHPAMILRDGSSAVFAKLAAGDEAGEQADSELSGLQAIAAAGVRVPAPIGTGRIDLLDGSVVLLLEAFDERADRTDDDWIAIGQALAVLHATTGQSYGAANDNFFGPSHQSNSPVEPNTWAEFYAVRRVLPWLRTARDVGAVDASTAARVEQLVHRLPELCGPDPGPRLLHGDAQHHNFLSTATGAVMIDASPYFGHPELDLALLDYFAPVPAQTWSAYAEIRPIDPGFAQRRELWRIAAYLGVLTVDPSSDFGKLFRTRLSAALDYYL